MNNAGTPVACGFATGAAACSDKACTDVIANPSQTVCVAYLSTCYFNGTACATIPTAAPCSTYALSNATGCNNLLNNGGPPAICGYVTGAAACSQKTCGDVIANPSTLVCTNYSAMCYFNGTNCVNRPAVGSCSSYSFTNATSCNNLFDSSIIYCGYVTGAAACSAKACGDVIANPS